MPDFQLWRISEMNFSETINAFAAAVSCILTQLTWTRSLHLRARVRLKLYKSIIYARLSTVNMYKNIVH